MKIIAEVSARHIHLTEDDFKILFGNNTSLSTVKKLSQEDDFSAEEKVKLIGPKDGLENVRIIGPFREYSQAEISFSDARAIGIDPPLRVSGHLPGTKIKVVGPEGEIEKDIAIIAKRHLHLPPEQAESLKLDTNDIVSVKCFGERGVVFDQIVVRVKQKYTVAVHFDTDEANAAGLKGNEEVELIVE